MISFGCKLDDLIGGGLKPGVLTHFFGPPASGKTNIALLASCKALGHGKVVYVDPEGGFSPERVQQMAGDMAHDVLENTLLVTPMTFEEQKIALEKIEDIVTSLKVGLVIVDSIAMLYRMEEDKDVRKLGRMLANLLRIARKHGIAVLLTNQVYSDFETKVTRPIGGTITEYFTKVIVELGRTERDVRIATLRRHSHKHEGECIEFKIVDKGIVFVNEYCTVETPLSTD